MIAAIDFETANSRPNSACQLGIVLLDGFQIVQERVWLIKPPRLFFSPQCVRVHGITARHCMDAPSWAEIWPEVRSLLDGNLVLGHNVGFDANVLLETSKHFEIPLPRLEFQCTRLLAKRAWPHFDGHGLANVARELGLSFRHHDALEDARTSALVAAQAADQLQMTTIESVEEHLGLLRGFASGDRIQNPRTVRIRRSDPVESIQPRFTSRVFRTDGAPPASGSAARRAKYLAQSILERARELQPLAGKHVVLVHTLLGLERQEAESLLEELGAIVHPRINLQTQFVILGSVVESNLWDWAHRSDAGNSPRPGMETVPEGDALLDPGGLLPSSPPPADALEKIHSEVEKRKELGQSIHTLSQRQLFALIPCASEIVRGE